MTMHRKRIVPNGWCMNASGDGHCSTLCTMDSDCGAAQRCAAMVFAVEGDVNQALPVCQHVGGAGTTCNGQTGCSGTDQCQPYLVGQPSANDPFVFVGTVSALCSDPLYPTGANVGESCSTEPCKNNFCVTGGQESLCTSPCLGDEDCPSSMVCGGSTVLYDNPAITINVCTLP